MITLFIGNGFDLDLGLKSTYRDFYHKMGLDIDINQDQSKLQKFLTSKRNTESWFDIEYLLKEYATSAFKTRSRIKGEWPRQLQEDYDFFSLMSESLKIYISRCPKENPIKTKSYARRVFELVSQFKNQSMIVSFNYSDTLYIMRTIDENLWIPSDNLINVHGSIHDSIILGIDETTTLIDSYDFLFKSWHENYQSNSVIDILEKSEEIVFFGISFGAIDMVYFKQFFYQLCKGRLGRKNITIFTKDNQSRISIFRELLKMGISIMEVKANCNLDIVYTNIEQCNNDMFKNFEVHIKDLYNKLLERNDSTKV